MLACVRWQECAQELAQCLAEEGDCPGTPANTRIVDIIAARVRPALALRGLEAGVQQPCAV